MTDCEVSLTAKTSNYCQCHATPTALVDTIPPLPHSSILFHPCRTRRCHANPAAARIVGLGSAANTGVLSIAAGQCAAPYARPLDAAAAHRTAQPQLIDTHSTQWCHGGLGLASLCCDAWQVRAVEVRHVDEGWRWCRPLWINDSQTTHQR